MGNANVVAAHKSLKTGSVDVGCGVRFKATLRSCVKLLIIKETRGG